MRNKGLREGSTVDLPKPSALDVQRKRSLVKEQAPVEDYQPPESDATPRRPANNKVSILDSKKSFTASILGVKSVPRPPIGGSFVGSPQGDFCAPQPLT